MIEYRTQNWAAQFRPDSWEFLGVDLLGPLTEDRVLDLSPCATLIALLNAASVLPVETCEPEESRP